VYSLYRGAPPCIRGASLIHSPIRSNTIQFSLRSLVRSSGQLRARLPHAHGEAQKCEFWWKWRHVFVPRCRAPSLVRCVPGYAKKRGVCWWVTRWDWQVCVACACCYVLLCAVGMNWCLDRIRVYLRDCLVLRMCSVCIPMVSVLRGLRFTTGVTVL